MRDGVLDADWTAVRAPEDESDAVVTTIGTDEDLSTAVSMIASVSVTVSASRRDRHFGDVQGRDGGESASTSTSTSTGAVEMSSMGLGLWMEVMSGDGEQLW